MPMSGFRVRGEFSESDLYSQFVSTTGMSRIDRSVEWLRTLSFAGLIVRISKKRALKNGAPGCLPEGKTHETVSEVITAGSSDIDIAERTDGARAAGCSSGRESDRSARKPMAEIAAD